MKSETAGQTGHRGARRRLTALAFCAATVGFAAAAAAQEHPSAPGATAASAQPAAPPAPSGSAQPAGSARPGAGRDAVVKIHDRAVFRIAAPRAGVPAADRALSASRALEAAVDEADEPEVRVEDQGEVAVIFVGPSPVVQLGAEDASAAGDASLSVHAAKRATEVRAALAGERKRHAAAQSVFSISLLVFSALIALLLVRKIGELADRARGYMAQNPERMPNLRVQGIDIISPRALSGALALSLGAGKALAQIGIIYAWVLLGLSLFESTRVYTTQLTQTVVRPLSGLMQRLAGSVPLLIVAAITGFALLLLLRFVSLFFRNVSLGHTSVGWVPRDLAPSTSVLVRLGIVVFALVLGVPLVTGNEEGALGRTGALALAALALASTPLLASAAVGVVLVFGRRLKVGEIADIAGRSGRITGLDLLETRLEDDEGCEVRVPHLLSLWHPTRVVGMTHIARAEVSVAADAEQPEVRELLLKAAAPLGHNARVDLVSFGAEGARYAVSVRASRAQQSPALMTEIAAALAAARVPLGRRPSEARAS